MNHDFNKDLKRDYSWLPKGVTSSIVNQIHSGSNSLITAFWSDGEFICAVLNSTVNSDRFQAFLWIIKYFLELRKIDVISKSIIMLDNAPYHWSKRTKEIMQKLELNISFLPPYSPILTPVEQFFKIVKTKVRWTGITNGKYLNSASGIQFVLSTWNTLSLNHLKHVWIEFVKVAFKIIIEI